jgi:hypothetical protein
MFVQSNYNDFLSNVDCSDQFALILAELIFRNKSLGKNEMFPKFKKAPNPILANDNDSQQNHFMDLMSTQNGWKILDEVREIMWFHHYSIHTEQIYCEWIRKYVCFHKIRSRDDLQNNETKIMVFLHCRNFEETTENERQHAKGHLLLLNGIGRHGSQSQGSLGRRRSRGREHVAGL